MKSFGFQNLRLPFRHAKILFRQIFFALLLFAGPSTLELLAQSPSRLAQLRSSNLKLRFDHLTVDHGLSNGVVNAILQDRKGFLWFGTNQGLNKYDGYQFTIYQHDPVDTTSLPNDQISALFEDRNGRLWIGTESSLLVRFDPVTERFLSYQLKIDSPAAHNTAITSIKSISEDSTGALWLITQDHRLFRFRPEASTGGIAWIDPVDIPDRCEVFSFHFDSSNMIWVAKDCGLHQLALLPAEAVATREQAAKRDDEGSSQRKGAEAKLTWMKRYAKNPQDPHGQSSNRITDIGIDSSGAFWLMTEQGLNRFDRDDGTFTSFPFPDRSGRFGGDNQLTIDGRNNLWVATNSGLVFFSSATQTYQWIGNNPSNPNSLSNNNIKTIYKDAGGVIWIGTNGNGLDRYAPYANKFHAGISGSGEEIWAARGMSIRALCETGSGFERTLWIGSYAGFFKFDRDANQFTNFGEDPMFAKLRAPSSPLYVQALLADRTGALWIGTGNKGLGRYDLHQGRFRSSQANPDDPSSLPHQSIAALYEARDGTIWVLTPGALSRFDRAAEKFTSYYFDRERSQARDRDMLPGCIMQDRTGSLWLGSEAYGLVRFDPASKSFRAYKHIPGDPASLSHDLVRAIHEDPAEPDRFLWIATRGGGLNRFDLRSEKFIHFTEKDGLSDNIAYGILADREGNLWISTNNGISKFNPQTGSFRNYGVSDGLQSIEFNTGAYYQSQSGEMFFGGINGFNAFYPEDVQDNANPPPVVITDFKLFNRSVAFKSKGSPLKQPITHASALDLSYRDKVITFEFVALDFNASAENRYAYKMENFDENWIDNGGNRTAHYTNLDPGEYVFRVKAANGDGVWNEKGAAIKIRIPPPPWKTWWAYTLYAIFALAAMYGVRRYELNRMRLKNQVRLEQMEAEKLKELDQLKSRFFANISHEFRTPLTLILGPLRNLRAGTFAGNIDEQYGLMERHASRLLRLINQLLDLSKLEAGGMELKAGRGNLILFLKGVLFSFESLAKQKQIRLDFQSDYDSLEVYFDAEKLEQAFYNLMSNAIKFTPAKSGGKISVTATRSQLSLLKKIAPNIECVEIKIKDNGIGIPADKLPRLFNRFYQVKSSHTREQAQLHKDRSAKSAFDRAHSTGQEGTGIGLALTKEIVELHYGEIHVMSEEGKGAEFIVTLPLGKEHLKENEIVHEGGIVEASDLAQDRLPVADIAEHDTDELTPAQPVRTGDEEIILIVEDNSEVRAFIGAQLSTEYGIIEAADGAAGLEAALEAVPDLIISDVMMPKLDGYELCGKLKSDERTSHIPVILLTARASGESRIAGLETGADDYLTKPFDSKELQVRVKNLIEQRRKLRERFRREVVLKPGEIAITSMDEQFLNRVKEVIEKHLGEEEFSVEDLAAEAGMSRVQLHRKLKALTDQSAGQFILSMRLQRAADLINQNAGTIAEVAYMTGFNTPNYFAKCFRKQFGCSPSEYKMKF